MYMFLLAGAPFIFFSCSQANDNSNLSGSGTDAEGNIREEPVGQEGGADINERGFGASGQDNTLGQNEQRDESTGTGLNPAGTDADTLPNTGRGTTSGTDDQGSGQQGTAPDTNPTRR